MIIFQYCNEKIEFFCTTTQIHTHTFIQKRKDIVWISLTYKYYIIFVLYMCVLDPSTVHTAFVVGWLLNVEFIAFTLLAVGAPCGSSCSLCSPAHLFAIRTWPPKRRSARDLRRRATQRIDAVVLPLNFESNKWVRLAAIGHEKSDTQWNSAKKNKNNIKNNIKNKKQLKGSIFKSQVASFDI